MRRDRPPFLLGDRATIVAKSRERIEHMKRTRVALDQSILETHPALNKPEELLKRIDAALARFDSLR